MILQLPKRRTVGVAYQRAMRDYGSQVGAVVAGHMRDVVLGLRQAALRSLAADSDEDLDEEGRPVDHMAGADEAFWEREAAIAAERARKIPLPESAIRAEAERLFPATVRSLRSSTVRAGVNRQRLADRLGVLVGDVLGIDMRMTARELAEQENWVAQNLELIRTVPDNITRQWAGWMEDRILSGATYSTITEDIRQRTTLSASDAERIGRDQVNKAQAQVFQAYAQEVGSDWYAWRVVNDERLRDSHEEVANRWWRFSQPPPDTGPYGTSVNPGEAIQCRCRAEIRIPPELFGGEPEPEPEWGSPAPR